jgi:hydrogenase nickel incorporation protein HypA/HybF
VETVHECAEGRPVRMVRLRVGQLAGVVPDALEFCFELATVGTALEGVVLEIEVSPGQAHCRTCEQDFSLDDAFLLCRCGSADVLLRSGRELTVQSVELD